MKGLTGTSVANGREGEGCELSPSRLRSLTAMRI